MILIEGTSTREDNSAGELTTKLHPGELQRRSSFSDTACSHPKSAQISLSCSKGLIRHRLPALDIDTSEDKGA